MKYFSMFSGVGGFELGIQRATNNEWECVGYSEIDKYSVQTFEKNIKGVKNYGDATKIIPEQLPDFDILCGGFPCQAFSIAGKREGFSDTRGTMFFEICRIVKCKRPRYLLLENVKGLLNHNKGETFATILQALDELGYDAEWQVLNSKHFGVSQNRERVFIVASLRGQPRPKVFPIGEDATKVQGILRDKKEETMNCVGTCFGRSGSSSEECEMFYRLNKTIFDRKNTNVPMVLTGLQAHQSIKTDGIVNCLPTAMGEGGGHIPMVMDYRNDEGFRIRKDGKSSCLASRKHSETDTSTMPPMVMNLQSRNPNRPSLTKLCPCGSGKLYKKCHGVDGGTGTLVKEDEAFCLDNACSQGVCFPTIIAQRGRNPKNPSDGTLGAPTEQRFEENKQGTSNVLTSVQKDNLVYQNQLRRLTPTECERLQGFPDGWTEGVSDTQRYKQMGNAVTVNVIEAIIKKINDNI